MSRITFRFSPLPSRISSNVDMGALAYLIAAAAEERVPFDKWADDLNQTALGRSPLDIDPFGDAVLHADHKNSLAGTDDARRWNQEHRLLAAYRPFDSRVHSRSQAAIGVRHIEFHRHGPRLWIDGPSHPAQRAIKGLGRVSGNGKRY